MGRLVRRATLLAALSGLLVATPVWADPAVPTHYRSTIETIVTEDGHPPPIELRVLGGDAFLVLRAESGVTVEVPGYEDEPYLRFQPDGTVEANVRSPAYWLNDARYGPMDVVVPPTADPQAPPVWEVVATGGEYAWHDHRIHYMSPGLPRQVDPGLSEVQTVMTWPVPLRIDGRDVVVHGRLDWLPGPRPWGVLAVSALALAALAAGLASRRLAAHHAALVGGLAATGAGLGTVVGNPPGAQGDLTLVAVPVGAVVAAIAAGVLLRRGDRRGVAIAAAGGVPLVIWAVLLAGALTRPIVPGMLPAGVIRIVVVFAAACGLAALGGVLRRPAKATPIEPTGPATSPAP